MSASPAATPAATAVWNIDPVHSVVEFKVRHMMISNARGQFSKVSGVLALDEAHPENSHVEASIEVDSLDTRDAQRDAHLKAADFFDAAQFPTITFRSTGVKAANGGGTVDGELTIHGVTRTVTLDVEGPTAPGKDPWGHTRIGAQATTKISRKEFGLTWNAALETGGVLIGDEVTITVDIQFVKAE